MENKNGASVFIFFVICTLFIIHNTAAQDSVSQDRPVHRLTWESEYALQYEIIIQRQVDDDYEDFFNDFTAEKFIQLSLPVGQYRFQVIPYDMLGHPGEPSYWAYLNVMPRVRAAEADPVYKEEITEDTEEKERLKNDFWLGLSADTAFYTSDGFAYGGGLTLGYGKRMSFGIKAAWFLSRENIDTLELNGLMRLYFFRDNPYYGPFLQVMTGYFFSFPNGQILIPSDVGMITAGVAAGWRFLINNYWFAEPYIRGGYPYMAGAGITFGFRYGEKRAMSNEYIDEY